MEERKAVVIRAEIEIMHLILKTYTKETEQPWFYDFAEIEIYSEVNASCKSSLYVHAQIWRCNFRAKYLYWLYLCILYHFELPKK